MIQAEAPHEGSARSRTGSRRRRDAASSSPRPACLRPPYPDGIGDPGQQRRPASESARSKPRGAAVVAAMEVGSLTRFTQLASWARRFPGLAHDRFAGRAEGDVGIRRVLDRHQIKEGPTSEMEPWRSLASFSTAKWQWASTSSTQEEEWGGPTRPSPWQNGWRHRDH